MYLYAIQCRRHLSVGFIKYDENCDRRGVINVLRSSTQQVHNTFCIPRVLLHAACCFWIHTTKYISTVHIAIYTAIVIVPKHVLNKLQMLITANTVVNMIDQYTVIVVFSEYKIYIYIHIFTSPRCVRQIWRPINPVLVTANWNYMLYNPVLTVARISTPPRLLILSNLPSIVHLPSQRDDDGANWDT